MKKIVTFIAFITLLSMNSHAQSSWIRQLPDIGDIVKMIPTIDGKYALLAYSASGGVPHNYILYKYDDAGNMEWRKESLPMNKYQVNDFIQLSNGNFVFVGRALINDINSTFLCVLDLNGDTISSKSTSDQYGFYKVIQANSLEIWTSGGNDTSFIYKFNFNGNFIGKKNINFIEWPSSWNIVKISFDTFIVANFNYQGSDFLTSFTIYNSFLDPLLVKYYNVKLGVLKNNSYNSIILHAFYNNYENKGLINLNINLDSLWTVPYSHYWTYGGTNYAPNDLIVTSDGGYAMCGTRIWTDHEIVYFIKTDDLGNPLIQMTYSSSIVDYTANILESPDGGYVMFQRASTNHTLWLVKTNSDGILPIEENFAYKWNDVTVYPNPVCSVANIDFNGEFSGELCVYNMLGQLKINLIISNETSTQIDVTNFQNGFYILKISNSNNKSVISKKIIKQ